MGFKSSPFQTVQGILVAEEVILGDRLDPKSIPMGLDLFESSRNEEL